MSYFFTIELFDEVTERLLNEFDCNDFFKLTLVSEMYDFDIQAHLAGEQLLDSILSDDELESLTLEYNPDFFPDTLILSDDIEEESDLELLDDIDFNITIDGLPHTETNLEIKDFIMNSYALIDETFESLMLRMNIMIDPDSANSTDFNTNITVH